MVGMKHPIASHIVLDVRALGKGDLAAQYYDSLTNGKRNEKLRSTAASEMYTFVSLQTNFESLPYVKKNQLRTRPRTA